VPLMRHLDFLSARIKPLGPFGEIDRTFFQFAAPS
jgi:hypothetical protein